MKYLCIKFWPPYEPLQIVQIEELKYWYVVNKAHYMKKDIITKYFKLL